MFFLKKQKTGLDYKNEDHFFVLDYKNWQFIFTVWI